MKSITRKTTLAAALIVSALGLHTAPALAGFGLWYAETAPAKPNLVETAVGAGQFNTLAKALGAAGLVDTLKGSGPFTVFAPTDAAFAQIPADRLNALLADKAALTRVITYHVVPGKVMASDVKSGPVKTVQGQPLTIQAGADGVRVDEARVIKTDILASNGVIHVIDKVVLPD